MKKYLLSTATTAAIALFLFAGQADASGYNVQSGDSLWKIANENNVSVQNLMNWNSLTSSTIFVGQNLTIQAPQSTQTTSQSYTVKSGDSLSVIARNYNTTVSAIQSLNNLSSDLIRVGQVLRIPGTSTVGTGSV
ncbi:LysM peptidoglycan-binding domain-containing protein [Evansella sp. AB-rgal1]|uniref:LysM peptidoglycan-binding domain-containing protein n=1 Tax=Evansella sp. AB-rgal1 TaxID=3242696 RepID=UPI00359E486E